MDPSRRDEKSPASWDLKSATPVDHVAEELVALLSRQHPLLVAFQVFICRRDQPEDFTALEYVIPTQKNTHKFTFEKRERWMNDERQTHQQL